MDDLACDSALVETLSPAVTAALYRKAARLEAELRAHLLSASQARSPKADTEPFDKVAKIDEAAALLGTTTDRLHRKWRQLGLAYRDPLDNRLKFPLSGLARYIRQHQKPGFLG